MKTKLFIIFILLFAFAKMTTAQSIFYETGDTLTPWELNFEFKSNGLYKDVQLTFKFGGDVPMSLWDSICVFNQVGEQWQQVSLTQIYDGTTIVSKVTDLTGTEGREIYITYIINCPVKKTIKIEGYFEGGEPSAVEFWLQARR